jgi:hypothetical protein
MHRVLTPQCPFHASGSATSGEIKSCRLALKLSEAAVVATRQGDSMNRVVSAPGGLARWTPVLRRGCVAVVVGALVAIASGGSVPQFWLQFGRVRFGWTSRARRSLHDPNIDTLF